MLNVYYINRRLDLVCAAKARSMEYFQREKNNTLTLLNHFISFSNNKQQKNLQKAATHIIMIITNQWKNQTNSLHNTYQMCIQLEVNIPFLKGDISRNWHYSAKLKNKHAERLLYK